MNLVLSSEEPPYQIKSIEEEGTWERNETILCFAFAQKIFQHIKKVQRVKRIVQNKKKDKGKRKEGQHSHKTNKIQSRIKEREKKL